MYAAIVIEPHAFLHRRRQIRFIDNSCNDNNSWFSDGINNLIHGALNGCKPMRANNNNG